MCAEAIPGYQQQAAAGATNDVQNGRFDNSGRKGINVVAIKEVLEHMSLQNRRTQTDIFENPGMVCRHSPATPGILWPSPAPKIQT